MTLIPLICCSAPCRAQKPAGPSPRPPELTAQTGNVRPVYSVAFSPDGKILASGGLGGTVWLWDVSTGREVRALSGHSASVQSVAFSPDGKSIASCGMDKTIQLWDVASGKELRTLDVSSAAK